MIDRPAPEHPQCRKTANKSTDHDHNDMDISHQEGFSHGDFTKDISFCQDNKKRTIAMVDKPQNITHQLPKHHVSTKKNQTHFCTPISSIDLSHQEDFFHAVFTQDNQFSQENKTSSLACVGNASYMLTQHPKTTLGLNHSLCHTSHLTLVLHSLGDQVMGIGHQCVLLRKLTVLSENPTR